MRSLASITAMFVFVMPAFATESAKPAAVAIEQSGQPDGVFEAVDMDAGAVLYADGCAQCHGRAGRGMASFPSLKGRDTDYISNRLERYRAGESIGPNSALMMPVSAELSDAEIANLAAFISEDFR
ncbi:cbb3-type cytochrome c oxidase subunit III [Roseinatronobacter thiooxidans]|uniref:Cbb3-type cytochrome c oxidase subunit III n=1 Tax=Roseinatronobacter thiooxidans TaxID=121821 RepID=A0A2W7QDJ7_9RHOB|nr:c-type cytochrome [Roseinatronobacter thiooxidans]PZX46243.1 cbb3-type cytochrome c oxidase subunit III [Roseinatronobacter thiooxidans]